MQQCIAEDSIESKVSNLTNFSYPPHSCGEKIKRPKKVAQFKTFKDVNNYNSAIVEYNIQAANYNKKINTYKSCINRYIKKGNNDISLIRNTLNRALKDARAK